MSVPSHAPFDWIAQKDLRDHPEISAEFGLDHSIIEAIKPISLITTEGLGEHPAIDIVEEMDIKNQLDPKTEKATPRFEKQICGSQHYTVPRQKSWQSRKDQKSADFTVRPNSS